MDYYEGVEDIVEYYIEEKDITIAVEVIPAFGIVVIEWLGMKRTRMTTFNTVEDAVQYAKRVKEFMFKHKTASTF